MNAEKCIKDLWVNVEALGFQRDGVSDQAERGDVKVLIGYGAGAVRVRIFKAGEKIKVFDITDRRTPTFQATLEFLATLTGHTARWVPVESA